MSRSLAFYIGARYTRAKRRNHFISFISLASMLGIALGVAALITVLSVMNGFDQEIRQRILSMTPHANVLAWGEPLRHWAELEKELEVVPEVKGVSPYVEGQAMINFRGNTGAALIKGILPEDIAQVYPLPDKMIQGNLNDLKAGKYGVVLGVGLAKRLNLKLGDKITLIAPEASLTPAGIVPRLKRFKVTGIFSVGYMFDNSYAFVHLHDAGKLFRTGGGVTGLQLRLSHYLQAPRIALELYEHFDGSYYINNWTQQHANYFQAVKMEKTLMFLILTLIVAVAAFNLVSTLVMVVTDKTSDIAILRTMGATARTIMRIFVVQGAIIGVVGTLLGLVAGVILASNVTEIIAFIEQQFHTKFLSADVYFISFLPSKLQWGDVLQVCSVSLVLSLLATLYPAWRAAKVQPAEALRYD